MEDIFLSVLVPNADYVILDYPDHSNVGDSAIYVGEMVLLRKTFKSGPSFVSSQKTFHSQVGGAPGKRIIFLHGGGNFGDTWPAHQVFRETVLERFPDNKIVQLPQSIQFDQVESLDRCARVIERHSDFTLFVRDQESFQLAQSKFDCEVKLCPDAALALGELPRSVQPEIPVLCLMRLDHEGAIKEAAVDEFAGFGPVEDWLDEAPSMRSIRDRVIERAARKVSFSRSNLDERLVRVYDRWAAARLLRGLAQISRAEFVVTDRLHVHILCSLAGIPHAVFDNSYGKITRYIDAWPQDGVGKVVKTMRDVRQLLMERQ